jgi:aminoglycoside phosphotransferase
MHEVTFAPVHVRPLAGVVKPDRVNSLLDDGEKLRTGLAEELRDRLAAAAPKQRHSGLVHADFRLGNVIVAPSGAVTGSSTGSCARSAT